MTNVEAARLFHQPRVAVVGRGRAVLIEELTVEDPAVVALVKAADDPAKLVGDALGIGARVLDREQAEAQTEYVRAEFERASREVEVAFTDRARVVAEHFGRKVDEVFAPDAGVLTRALERHFSDGSAEAVQHRVRRVVDEVLAQSRKELLQQFSSADGLLADFKRGVTDTVRQASERSDQTARVLLARMQELQLEVERLRGAAEKAEAVEAEAERGTAKGRTFEAAIADAVDAIAAAKGDDSDAVGDQPGAGGKKGDVVVGIDGAAGPCRARIVFEAKDRQLSKQKALAELDGALVTRDAQYAVLVVPSEEHLPARTHQLREYGGDKVFVVADPDGEAGLLALEVAYSLARARALMARGGGDRLDPALLATETERALTALDEERRIKQQLTAATTAIERSRAIVEGMAASVRGHLKAIEELVHAAQAGAAE